MIDVSSDRDDRCDRFQALQQAAGPTSPACTMRSNRSQRFGHRITQEPVRIGNKGESFNRVKLPGRAGIGMYFGS